MIQAQYKTYVANFTFAGILPGAVENPSLSILNAGRVFFVRRVLWSLFIMDAVTAERIPLAANTVLTTELSFGLAVPAVPAGRDFNSLLPPAPDVANRAIRIFDPGQFSFDNLEFQNECRFDIGLVNNDLINTYYIVTNLTVMIQEGGRI